MKKFTVDEIFDYLTDYRNECVYVDDFGKASYVAWYDKEKQVLLKSSDHPVYVDGVETFYEPVTYDYEDAEDMDFFYSREERDNPDFMEIVEDMTRQINEFLEEEEL